MKIKSWDEDKANNYKAVQNLHDTKFFFQIKIPCFSSFGFVFQHHQNQRDHKREKIGNERKKNIFCFEGRIKVNIKIF